MRRGVVLVVAAMLAMPAAVARGASQPVVTGKVEGLETCAQATCGAATFVGTSALQLGTAQARGAFLVQVTHAPLPGPGATAAVTGGQWALSGDLLILTGAVTGGTLANNGNNTFTVSLTLAVQANGTGTLRAEAVLDHNTLPPTIVGVVFP